MADLAATGLTPDQCALVMELSAAVATEARPVVDTAAENKRAYDRAYQMERRRNRTMSYESCEPSDGKEKAPDPKKKTTPLNGSPKGEPIPPRSGKGTRLPADFVVPEDWKFWAMAERKWDRATVETESASFVDHWSSKPGKDGLKTNWHATFRNWIRGSRRPDGNGGAIASRRPMNASELRRAIAFAEDNNDLDRLAELKAQLETLRQTGPPPEINRLVRGAAQAMRVGAN